MKREEERRRGKGKLEKEKGESFTMLDDSRGIGDIWG